MQYDEFIKAVGERGGHSDREAALRTTQVVLADLGQRLKGRGGEPGSPASRRAQGPSD
ncbi:DUF2267 domain-containing protein [Nesterenkonia pannonica]|uniref:DUF2267 domain-containing protein n=1 Tax=Nesterenkonia pannonica TaxID=1548602 RepID=UPI0021645FED|nr:DUF2267 domain-containing protein [Nesterenkonia pannonica]